MVSSEVYTFSYNATKNDDKIYFSDQLCYKISLVWVKAGKPAFLVYQKNGQLICIVKGNLIYRIKSKSAEVSCAIIIGLAALLWVPSPVEGMGMPLVLQD
jgi:hypothetical protein